MVMVIMDIAPLAWCISMYLRSVFSERLPTSSSETSLSNRRNSNNLPNSSRTVSFTLVEVAEILSVTMKKWSPAYQLNEMIMRRCDGCLLGHAAWCKLNDFIRYKGVVNVITVLTSIKYINDKSSFYFSILDYICNHTDAYVFGSDSPLSKLYKLNLIFHGFD